MVAYLEVRCEAINEIFELWPVAAVVLMAGALRAQSCRSLMSEKLLRPTKEPSNWLTLLNT